MRGRIIKKKLVNSTISTIVIVSLIYLIYMLIHLLIYVQTYSIHGRVSEPAEITWIIGSFVATVGSAFWIVYLHNYVKATRSSSTLSELVSPREFNFTLSRTQSIPKREGPTSAHIWVGLCNMETIRDTYRRPVVNAFLRLFTHRLLGCVPQSTVSSQTGVGEFSLLVPNVSSAAAAGVLAERILQELHQPIRVGGTVFHPKVNIGLSIYSVNGGDATDQIGVVGAAASTSEPDESDEHSIYLPGVPFTTDTRPRVEERLGRALLHDEFELYYQPKVGALSHRLTGLEGLIRWNTRTDGQISPGLFIPVAEKTDLIVSIGRWVIQEACRQIAEWRSAGASIVPVAVNVSVRQLREPNFVTEIIKILQNTGTDPRLLQLEITESVFMDGRNDTLKKLHALRDQGITVAIDDFGTGYSSLRLLGILPVDTLKIDQSFVTGIAKNHDHQAIADAIMLLASDFGLKTVAEGVSNQDEASFMESLGCDELQGYHFGRPMTAEHITDILRGTGASSRTVVGLEDRSEMTT